MNKINDSYLYNQTTCEKSKGNLKKSNEFLPTRRCIYDNKRANYFQYLSPESSNQSKLLANFTDNKNDVKAWVSSEMNEKKSYKQNNNNYFYSSLNSNNNPLNDNRMIQIQNINKGIINNNDEIQSYKHYNKKSIYQRYNSLAYIKKRPNDLIKIKSSENNYSLIRNKSKYLRNSFKMKGRYLSCTSMKYNINILNYNDKEGDEIINNFSKKSFIPVSYPYISKNEHNEKNVNYFSAKKQSKLLKKIFFVNSIFNILKKNLINNKIIFFKKLKDSQKALMYEVSFKEYKFLEELKALGVTNKKELNFLLKDIYISIKGDDTINNNKK